MTLPHASSLAPLPGAPFLQRAADASLQFDGVALDVLAAEHGTPLYVYSAGAMRAALAAYQAPLQRLRPGRHRICYGMKANPALAVLQLFARAGCGFDIVSLGELQRVLAVGADPAGVVFSGVGKQRNEMVAALQAGIGCFNVESTAELEALSEVGVALGRRAPVSLRINPDVDARTHAYIATGLRGNKFGIAHDEALATYARAAALPGVKVVGIDCHIGSQITQVAPFLEALDRLLDLVEAIEAQTPCRIDHVDIGGGLGIVYDDEAPPGADALMEAVCARMEARGHGARTLLLEPGRSLVGNAGVLLTEVVFLKPGAEKNFCIVDAAMNDLLRPTLYGAWMRVEPLQARQDATPALLWDVVGPVCESGDWLAKDRRLAVQAGDRLAVCSAGAYVASMASNYNARGRAAEVMVDAGRATLIRPREDSAALFASERLIDPA